MRWQNSQQQTREPHITEDRLATFGQDFAPQHISAPDHFTAQVMARIETQPTPRPAAVLIEHRLREGLLVVGVTLVFSLTLLLGSIGVLALFLPTKALMLLGTLISGTVALLNLARHVSLWLTSPAASEVMIAALALLASVAVLVRLGIMRFSTQTPREA